MSGDSRLLEPVAVTVRRPSGEVIAELLMNPRRTVKHVKMQLTGLVGTPVGNQTLLFAGRSLEDNAVLGTTGVLGSVSVMMVECEPILKSSLTLSTLENLLRSDEELDHALDGYSEQLTLRELQAICESARVLVPEGRASTFQMPLHFDCCLPGEDPSTRSGARQRFRRTLRRVLEELWSLARAPSEREVRAEERSSAADSGEQAREATTVASHAEGEVRAEERSSAADSGEQACKAKAVASRPEGVEVESQWRGAGSELRRKLTSRWNTTTEPIC